MNQKNIYLSGNGSYRKYVCIQSPFRWKCIPKWQPRQLHVKNDFLRSFKFSNLCVCNIHLLLWGHLRLIEIHAIQEDIFKLTQDLAFEGCLSCDPTIHGKWLTRSYLLISCNYLLRGEIVCSKVRGPLKVKRQLWVGGGECPALLVGTVKTTPGIMCSQRSHSSLQREKKSPQNSGSCFKSWRQVSVAYLGPGESHPTSHSGSWTLSLWNIILQKCNCSCYWLKIFFFLPYLCSFKTVQLFK